jgi:hypothetical protein
LSLKIFVNVLLSLQDTLGLGFVVRYSPTIASICFFVNGVNPIEVGFPTP